LRPGPSTPSTACALVGMFDFQVAEDVAITKEILAGKLNRQRKWLA
jgi:hypothetical protein